MRQIKASEVKPGMTVRWEQDGAKIQLPVHSVEAGVASVGLVALTKTQWCLGAETPVTVLAEPQPEEPTEFGAKVIVDGEKFLRAQHPISVPVPWLSESDGTWRNWATILAMGSVQVIPDQGWTVPETPEVPERIDEWPESDERLRPYPWRDRLGRTWLHGFTGVETGWSGGGVLTWKKPFDGPWTRVTTNTISHEKKENV